MKLILLAFVMSVALAAAGNYTLTSYGIQTVQMIPSNATTWPKCNGFSISYMTCSDYNTTVEVNTDPQTLTWKRAMFMASGVPTPTTGYSCYACFDSTSKTSIESGDKGVGACWNSTTAAYNGTAGVFLSFGTIEATAAKKFKAAADQGYVDNFKAVESSTSAGTWTYATGHTSGGGTNNA
jgi:hypothetical protein